MYHRHTTLDAKRTFLCSFHFNCAFKSHNLLMPAFHFMDYKKTSNSFHILFPTQNCTHFIYAKEKKSIKSESKMICQCHCIELNWCSILGPVFTISLWIHGSTECHKDVLAARFFLMSCFFRFFFFK